MAKENSNAPADGDSADPAASNENTELTDATQKAAADAYRRLADTASQLADQAQHVYASGQATVRSHPGEFLVGAFAVGVLVGVLVDRL